LGKVKRIKKNKVEAKKKRVAKKRQKTNFLKEGNI
jgi:hypothetical protein